MGVCIHSFAPIFWSEPHPLYQFKENNIHSYIRPHVKFQLNWLSRAIACDLHVTKSVLIYCGCGYICVFIVWLTFAPLDCSAWPTWLSPSILNWFVQTCSQKVINTLVVTLDLLPSFSIIAFFLWKQHMWVWLGINHTHGNVITLFPITLRQRVNIQPDRFLVVK